jgi:hypothetical protein
MGAIAAVGRSYTSLGGGDRAHGALLHQYFKVDRE